MALLQVSSLSLKGSPDPVVEGLKTDGMTTVLTVKLLDATTVGILGSK